MELMGGRGGRGPGGGNKISPGGKTGWANATHSFPIWFRLDTLGRTQRKGWEPRMSAGDSREGKFEKTTTMTLRCSPIRIIVKKGKASGKKWSQNNCQTVKKRGGIKKEK